MTVGEIDRRVTVGHAVRYLVLFKKGVMLLLLLNQSQTVRREHLLEEKLFLDLRRHEDRSRGMLHHLFHAALPLVTSTDFRSYSTRNRVLRTEDLTAFETFLI